MKTLHQVDVAVEHPYMSGTFAEALDVQVEDYGGNILWSGRAADYVANPPRYRGSVKLVATRLGRRADCVAEFTAAFYSSK